MYRIQHSQKMFKGFQYLGTAHQLKQFTNYSNALKHTIDKINPKVTQYSKPMTDASEKIIGLALLLGINTVAVMNWVNSPSKNSAASLAEKDRYNLLKKELFSIHNTPTNPPLTFIDLSMFKKNNRPKPLQSVGQRGQWVADNSVFKGATLLELSQYPKNTVSEKRLNELNQEVDVLKNKIEEDKKQHQRICAALMASQVFVLISVLASHRASG